MSVPTGHIPEVPDSTSTTRAEPRIERNVLPFAPELVGFILAGDKFTTYRFGMKYDYLKVGDEVAITNSQDGSTVGTARIVSKEAMAFADLPLATPGHESYRDKEHQREVLNGYYAYVGRPIRDDDPFLVLAFKLDER